VTAVQRSENGHACAEVTDRLHAVDVAVASGVDPHNAALDRLREWARRRAEEHGYGGQEREP
jgi:hypothetical protein